MKIKILSILIFFISSVLAFFLLSNISHALSPNEKGSISGTAFKDTNNNGIWDLNEEILFNTRVNLNQNGQTIQTTTSDTQGKYIFQNVPFGEYQISINSIGPTETIFIKVESFEISDLKIEDKIDKKIKIIGKANSDSKIEIEVNARIFTTISDASGNWSLTATLSDLKSGSYNILGESFKGTGSSGKIVINSFNISDENLFDLLSGLRENPEIQKTIKENVVPATATAAAVSTAAVSSSISFAQIIWSLWNFISSILSSLGLRKKEKDWGFVYDSVTRKPVKLAIVRIFNGENAKLITTRITDENGRFGVILNPGSYLFSATKKEFTFPSKIEIDEIPNVYKGGKVEISENNLDQFNIDIPLDPVGVDIVERPLKVRVWYRLLEILRTINPYVLFAGLLISIAATYLVTTWYNFLILTIYIILIITKYALIGKQKRALGKVFNAASEEGIEGAIVQIFEAPSNRLKETVTTDKFGRFKLIAEPGQYQLTSQKPHYQFPSKSFTKLDEKIYNNPQKTIKVKSKKDAVIKVRIPMDRSNHFSSPTSNQKED
jgi:hypothetical protein